MHVQCVYEDERATFAACVLPDIRGSRGLKFVLFLSVRHDARAPGWQSMLIGVPAGVFLRRADTPWFTEIQNPCSGHPT